MPETGENVFAVLLRAERTRLLSWLFFLWVGSAKQVRGIEILVSVKKGLSCLK